MENLYHAYLNKRTKTTTVHETLCPFALHRIDKRLAEWLVRTNHKHIRDESNQRGYRVVHCSKCGS